MPASVYVPWVFFCDNVFKYSGLDPVVDIQHGTVEHVLSVPVPEFDNPYTAETYEDRLSGRDFVILVAFEKNIPLGYVVGYNMEDSFYLWMAGVDPKHRGRHILATLMGRFFLEVRERGYSKITVKTRNKYRSMIHYLVKAGFDFILVEPQDKLKENRLFLEKII